MKQRVQKILAQKGIASRRKAEDWIQAGLVTVNGEVAKLGDQADEQRDQICIDGQPIGQTPQKVYILLNKPRGFVTTVSDEKGRKTVLDLLPDPKERIYPVGRLDIDSEGLLILTNDGDFTYQITHPKGEVDKEYLVEVAGFGRRLGKLSSEMTIDGYKIKRPKVKILQKTDNGGVLRMIIHEGRNRQIRKMCAKADLKVLYLKRTAIGTLRLGGLRTGQSRDLTPEEVLDLLKLSKKE